MQQVNECFIKVKKDYLKFIEENSKMFYEPIIEDWFEEYLKQPNAKTIVNINLEYLNMKLQDKIYINENPLSFEKLISTNRMQIFSTMQDYLDSKKLVQNKIIPMFMGGFN